MAEKFRPRHIDDVIGQNSVKNMIKRSLRNKSFPKFSLMYGPSGTGKSTMAEICGLSLTCCNPQDGEACCKCDSCRANLSLLNNGQKSMNLVKINMGAIERTDFKKTIKEVFTLQPIMGDNAVYIFEEIQALTKDEQNILLEYISNIRNNIYIIACTTELFRLRQELRNRAIKFQFKQLKTDEALTLLNKICDVKSIAKPPKDIATFLLRSVDNCPREIVNTIDYLADANSFDGNTLSDFLGYVSNKTYIEYMEKCKLDSYEFVAWLDTIADGGYQNIVKGLRNFLVDCYGYIYGSNKQYFNTQEKHRLISVFSGFDESRMLDMMKFFNDCKYDDDTSAKYCLIEGRMRMNGKSTKAVFSESKREAVKSVIQSEKKSKEFETIAKRDMSVQTQDLDSVLLNFEEIKR